MKRIRVSPGRVQITYTSGSKVSNIRVGNDWIVRSEPWHVRLWNWVKALFN